MGTPSRERQLIDGVWQYVTASESPGGGLPAGGSTGEVLTKESNADGDAGWEPGGGSQAVLSATVPLTNAQIKALPGTDIQLVAAPGASKMIVPLYAFLTADFAVAYSGIDASSEYPALWVAHARLPIFLAEFINDPDSFATPLTSLTDLLTGTNEFGAILWRMLPLAQSYITGGAPSNAFVIAGGAGPGPGDLDNAPLKIGADNSINFTGGDAANSMKVTVLYTVLDI